MTLTVAALMPLLALVSTAAPGPALTAAPAAVAAHTGGFNLLWPIVAALQYIITAINGYTHNLGWSLIALAIIIRVAFWPLNTMQFKSMAKMQELQPQMKALQEKFSSDPARLNQETMALYKAHGTHPFAGCLPLVLQLPILFSLYQAISANHEAFTHTTFAWIGTSWAAQFPQIFASNLAVPDFALLAAYVASMYLSVRFSSPQSSDPQQAMTQQIMAIVSPTMIAFVGRNWPSALILFWLTSNIIQTAQQFMLRYQRDKSGAAGQLELSAAGTTGARSASPMRDAAHSSRRPRKGPRRSSR